MKKDIQKGLTLLVVFVPIIISCFIFRIYILEYIIKPVAMMFWILLRMSILSIDQEAVWNILIILFIIILIYGLQLLLPEQKQSFTRIENFYLNKLDFWQYNLSGIMKHREGIANRKDKLTELMVEYFAAKKRITTNYTILEAFRKKEILIPDNIYQFLFHDTEKNRKKFNPLHVFNRISGRAQKEYRRNLYEYLFFLENNMEVQNDGEFENTYFHKRDL